MHEEFPEWPENIFASINHKCHQQENTKGLIKALLQFPHHAHIILLYYFSLFAFALSYC